MTPRAIVTDITCFSAVGFADPLTKSLYVTILSRRRVINRVNARAVSYNNVESLGL